MRRGRELSREGSVFGRRCSREGDVHWESDTAWEAAVARRARLARRVERILQGRLVCAGMDSSRDEPG